MALQKVKIGVDRIAQRIVLARRYAFQGSVNIEVETNGTVAPQDSLVRFLFQVNCSPKLGNSGMARERRYRPGVLEKILSLPVRKFFKFVVTSPQDLEEIQRDFVEALHLEPRLVYLMPEGTDRAALQGRRQWVIEQCKRYGFRYSDRLQVLVWDRVTGV